MSTNATVNSLGNCSAETHFARATIAGTAMHNKPWFFKMTRMLILESELQSRTAVWKKVSNVF
jgi:hypothetical protein